MRNPNRKIPGLLYTHNLSVGKAWSHWLLVCLWLSSPLTRLQVPVPFVMQRASSSHHLAWGSAFGSCSPEFNLQLSHGPACVKYIPQHYPPLHLPFFPFFFFLTWYLFLFLVFHIRAGLALGLSMFHLWVAMVSVSCRNWMWHTDPALETAMRWLILCLPALTLFEPGLLLPAGFCRWL